MPKVNRIRVCNIKLDKGDKVFGDKTFNLYGNNSIFILENGGGKTSLIQMVLQVVLPNYASSEKRMLKNTVLKDNTVHIAVEWIPDDENYEKFITGYAFHNYGGKLQGNEKKKQYDYFNYIIETDYAGAPKLEEIEFVQYGKVTRIDELKRELKKLKGVQTFDTNSEYQDVLKQYGLLESEWKNIAKVNGEEGGVKEFFQKTATTKNLIEKLFIPSLLGSFFESEEERKAILVAFKTYKDSLLELPKLEKDLNDFKVVTSHSDNVIDACERYNDVLKKLKDSQRGLSRLYKSIEKDSKANVEWLAAAREELQAMERTKKELGWKLDSYKIFLEKQVAKTNKDALSQLKTEIKAEQDKQLHITLKVKEQNAAKWYRDYTIQHHNASEVSAKLNALTLESTGKSKALEESQIVVSENYRYLLNQNLLVQKQLKDRRKDIIELQKESTLRLKQLNKEKESLTIKKTKAEMLVIQHQEDEVKLKKQLIHVWETDIANTEQKLFSQLEEEKKRYLQLDEALTQVEADLKTLGEKIFDSRNQLTKLERKKDETEKAFETFSSKEAEWKNKVSAHLSILVRDNLFDDQQRIVNQLQSRKENLDQEVIRWSIEVGHLEQIKLSIEQRGYHVHNELELVREYLTKKGIDVVLGIDLLTKLDLPEQQKRELVKKNPLLTFAIAIENQQVASVRRALEGYKKELSVPIFLIDRTTLEQQEEKEGVFSLNDHLHVFHRFQVRFNTEDWEKYVVELDRNISELKQLLTDIRVKKDEILSLENGLKLFWQQYHSLSRQTFGQELRDIEKKWNAETETLATLLTGQEKKEEEKETTKTDLQQCNNQVTKCTQELSLIEQFTKRYETIDQTKQQLSAFIENIKKMDETIDLENEQANELGQEKETIVNSLNHYQTEQNTYNRDAKEYHYLLTDLERIVTLEEYANNRSVYNALRQEMSGELVQIEGLRTTLTNYEQFAGIAADEIKKQGFTVESMSKQSIVYDESLLEEQEAELEEVKDTIASLIRSKEAVKSAYDTSESAVVTLTNQLSAMGYEQEGVFEYGSSFENEHTLYVDSSEQIKASINKLTEEANHIQNVERDNQTALDELKASREFLVDLYSATPFEDDHWKKEKTIQLVRDYKTGINQQKEQLVNKQIAVKKAIDTLIKEAGETQNHTIISMTRDLTRVLEGTKEDYEQIISTFVVLLEGIQKFEEAIGVRKTQTEIGRDLLIDLMYERSELLHRNILEIQKSTQVVRAGEVISYFRFHWPKKEDEDIKRQLRDFVDSLLLHLTELQSASATDEELEKEFERRADMLNILSCYADVNRCKIEALKPRNEFLAAKKEWALWDDTPGWSNGELHATRMSMFIGFNSHLRKKRYSRENSWKFLVVDNPFGEASSDHVVSPMIDLAIKSHTQLFCFTGINEINIRDEFETVIHNKYIPQRGILFLDSTMEYKKEEDKDAAILESLFYAK
jgi:hypothetical protein